MKSEGTATTLDPEDKAFFNPIQEFNRDISVAAITAFQHILKEEWKEKLVKTAKRKDKSSWNEEKEAQFLKDEEEHIQKKSSLKILEGLSATGLRSIRYYKEIPNVDHILANDLEASAVSIIKQNIANNGLSEDQVKPSHADCNYLLHRLAADQDNYDVIDLDPYGTASPFLDGSVQCVKNGGLLCVTCTDMAVLAGNNPGTCFSKYGSVPLRGKYFNEMALRIVLHAIQQSASRYKRFIVPLLSLQIDYYLRVFVRVYQSPKHVKTIYKKISNVFQCGNCPYYQTAPLADLTSKGPKAAQFEGHASCPECQSRFRMGGPIYADSIQDVNFIERVMKLLKANPSQYGTHRRGLGMLHVAKSEAPFPPLCFNLPWVCSAFKTAELTMDDVQNAILNGNYGFSRVHCHEGGFKTTAPHDFVFDVLRGSVKRFEAVHGPPSEKRQKKYPESVRRLRSKEMTHSISFERHPNLVKIKPGSFLPNPEANWGPQARPTNKKARKAKDALKDHPLEPPTKKLKK